MDCLISFQVTANAYVTMYYRVILPLSLRLLFSVTDVSLLFVRLFIAQRTRHLTVWLVCPYPVHAVLPC